MPLPLVDLKSRWNALIRALRCAKVIAEKLYAPPDHDEWGMLFTLTSKRDEPNEWPPIPGAYSAVIDYSLVVAKDEHPSVVKDEKPEASKKRPRRTPKSKTVKGEDSPFILKDESYHDDDAYVPPTPVIVDRTTPIRCSKRIAELPVVDYQKFYEFPPPLRHTPDLEEAEPSNENDLKIAATGCDDVQMDSVDPEPQSREDHDGQVDYTELTLQPARYATPTSATSSFVSGMPSDVTFPMPHPQTPSRQLSFELPTEESGAPVASSEVDVDILAAIPTASDLECEDMLQDLEDEDYFRLRAQGDHDTRVVYRKVSRAREDDDPPPDLARPNKRMKSVSPKGAL